MDMDILTFITKITNSLAWPSAAVIGLCLIKKNLFKFISSIIRLTIRYKDFEVDIDKKMAEVKNKQDAIEAMLVLANINRTEPRKHEP